MPGRAIPKAHGASLTGDGQRAPVPQSAACAERRRAIWCATVEFAAADNRGDYVGMIVLDVKQDWIEVRWNDRAFGLVRRGPLRAWFQGPGYEPLDEDDHRWCIADGGERALSLRGCEPFALPRSVAGTLATYL